jgi:hypothetical protein
MTLVIQKIKFELLLRIDVRKAPADVQW